MLSEGYYKGARILQFDLLLECQDLFHAVFLKDTPHTEVEKLVDRPIYQAQQIHSNLLFEAPALAPCDGLFTREKERALLIKHADCQAAIFYDPLTSLLAAVHAGWRGLVQQIYTSTLQQFKEKGAHPQDILVAIGPSLGPEQAEFKGWRDYFPLHFAEAQVKENYFDLREVARQELLVQGILPHHLSIAPHCTACDSDRFHSWRRDKTAARHATLAWMT